MKYKEYYWGEAAWTRAMIESKRDPHELWAARLKGIEDGVKRIEEILGGPGNDSSQAI